MFNFGVLKPKKLQNMFTEQDLKQIAAHGLTVEAVERHEFAERTAGVDHESLPETHAVVAYGGGAQCSDVVDEGIGADVVDASFARVFLHLDAYVEVVH